jgi:hypothetical protein
MRQCKHRGTFTSLRPPLWSSGQSSWLQIQRSGFDSWRYHIFWGVVGLERGSLSLVRTVEELLGRNSSGSGLESREYGCRDPSHWPRGTHYPQNFLLLFYFTPALVADVWSASCSDSLTPRVMTPTYSYRLDKRLCGFQSLSNGIENKIFLTIPGIEPLALGCPARSQYRLRHPGYLFACFSC